MKNHQYIDGKLLQTNKRFSDLKESQRIKIAEWLYEEYKKQAIACGKITKVSDEVIIDSVMSKISEAEIWIPTGEVVAFYFGRKNRFAKRLEKETAK